jgi:protein disulfide isomerase
MKNFVAFGLLALFASVAFAVEYEDNVMVLTESNFDDVIANEEIILVEFYAPWCGHCKKLTPEYAKAAAELKKDKIPLAKVDATVEKELGSRFGVTGYPTLKVFKSGVATAYSGPREADGIVKYMKKQAEPATKAFDNWDAAKKFINDNNDFTVVGFFQYKDDSKYKRVFLPSADEHREQYKFLEIFDEAAIKAAETDLKMKDLTGQILILSKDTEPQTYTGATAPPFFAKWLHRSTIPLVGEFSENTQARYQSVNATVVKTFIDVDWKGANLKRTTYYLNRIKKVAEEFKGKIYFVVEDKKGMKTDFARFGLDGAKEAQIVIENLQTTDRYKYSGDFSVENLRQFVTDFLDGKVKQHIKSEPVPTEQGPVTVVVGETFRDVVLDTTKDVLIELYAPWCGHCKKLEPVYNELAEALKNQPNVVIAKMDATANDATHPEYQAKGYPTILFAPANSKDKPVKFAGTRDVAGFTDFLKKHMSLPWVSEKTEL